MGWNTLVSEGEWKRALERLLDTNNFPEFTGTTCPAPCEEACVLGINESAVSIKSIENAIIERGFAEGWLQPKLPLSRSGFRVAVVGSGPTGLAAAQQLNRAGHIVHVYEKSDMIGGLLMYGIPNMKLAKEKVERRVNLLKKEGIQFFVNSNIGDSEAVRKLSENEYNAVLFATGAQMARKSEVPGSQLGGVIQAMDFLTETQKAMASSAPALADKWDCENKHVVVIGGGDTSVDCIGIALRQNARSVTQFSRRGKAPEQKRTRTLWPAWDDTYRSDYAQEEFSRISGGKDVRAYGMRVAAFEGAQKRVKKVRSECGQIFDADVVILAMGFTGSEKIPLDPYWASENAISVPSKIFSRLCESSVEDYTEENVEENLDSYHLGRNIFYAGDCRRGASLVVTAIAEGRDVANRIDEFLLAGAQHSALPRCIPISQNPSLFSVSRELDHEPVHNNHNMMIRKRQKRLMPLSEGFERGLA